MLQNCLILMALLLVWPQIARADGLHGPDSPGYNQPDPPNTIAFDRIRLRVVKAPILKVPDTCDATYRAGMEDSFRRIWEQCQAIGNTEPSDCQRNLFDRCTRVANDLQKMEVSTCTEMHGEKDTLDRIRNPDNQKNSQVSSADLNRRAAVASRRVSDALAKNAQALAAQRQAASNALKANACAFSSAAAQYRATESKLITELSKNEKFVKAQAEAKKAAADQFERLGGKAATSASQLKSTVAVNPSNQASTNASTITSAPADVSPGSTYTVTENGGIVAPTTQTIVSTSTVVTTTESSFTVMYPKPRSFDRQIDFPDDNERKIPRWVPILAVGVPAAILAGLVISRMSKSNPGGSSGGDQGGGPSGGDPGGTDSGTSPGGSTTTLDPVPGGGDLRSLEMQIDSSFTDAQKSTIAASVQRIPECYRNRLKGLEVRNASLGGRDSSGRCVAGTFRLGGNLVKLDGRGCVGIQVGVTVHEFFHVIGNRNGNAVHSRYRSEVVSRTPSCPVSRYGATNFYEDFAEAGRIVTVPSKDRNNSACVNTKLNGMKQILTNCQ